MRVGIVGTRGLPPEYGGYETFAGHLVEYFIPRGHQVLVACEGQSMVNRAVSYNGAQLLYFPFKPPKNYSIRKIYEVLNDLYFYLYLARKCDILYILAGLGTQLLPMIKLLNPGVKIVTNNDGIEWEREKYGFIERTLWKSFIRSSLSWSDLVIFDNEELQERFPRHNSKKSITIEYGVNPPEQINWSESNFSKEDKIFPRLSELRHNGYYLVVARLQKDNNTHRIIEGFLLSKTKKHLVIVGDSLDSSYQNHLNSLVSGKEDRVIFAGGIYDQTKLNMIRQHCFAHIHGHSAGGTNPSLLEAMVMGKAILAHRNPFNSNVLGSNELSFYDSESLSNAVNMLEADQILRSRTERRNRIRAKKKFTWERCFSKHERAFKALFDREFRSKMLSERKVPET